MKYLIMATALFVTTVASANSIRQSTKEVDHQVKISDAVWSQCGWHKDLTEVSEVVREEKVDQGIVDLYYTTKMHMTVRIDQGYFEQYEATVESILSDSYDHQAKRWGAYRILSVSCKML